MTKIVQIEVEGESVDSFIAAGVEDLASDILPERLGVNTHELTVRILNKQAWLIWSLEHDGFWRASGNGYTKDRDEAGRYSFEEACEIVRSANQYCPPNRPNETMFRDETSLTQFP